ncbi:MIF4G like-domain-containing protein [Suillus fuscotomentosus]|uniref:MIF4G like-domain-containing protein n=1 Tax=Suillus fuscotomentosus TaxID=1912939 RepID=A0AAD4ED60_9AGAM|nr:MIF4G like-domain-containing protein [Suillus fuscotomentosus]KAG1902824.1 MIF4G like-domain-containing protein [Suillus fuscotomentosus]
MSYDRSHYDRPHRGGGNRRRYKDDYDAHDRRTRDSFESPEQILKNTIIKLGEVDPIQELPRLAKQIREQVPLSVPVISEGIRIAVTEQPYKIPYYAALLRLLHDPTEGENAESSTSSSLGKQVLEDFWKGFQGYLDKLAWRDVRLCIHFFAHLTVAQVISIESMSALLQSFAAVLDEFGVSYGRGRNAALCAIEGLIISGAVMAKSSSSNTTEIIKTVQNYNDSIYAPKLLVQPAMSLFTESRSLENADEVIDTGLFVLKALDSFEFVEASESFPQPYLDFPDLDPTVSAPFELPAILVPPEVIELDGLATDAGEDAQVKKEDWPQYFFHLFDNDTTPDSATPAGFLVRSQILDTIDIFEINRKECARLLLEYPKWCVPGTFKPKPGAPEPEFESGKNWQLESTVIEAILGSLYLLPESTHKTVYHIALITELCKLSPSTVGPAVGKSIRRLYTALGDGFDVENARRFAEWFAVHMSNFGFQWVWKEWLPDLELSEQHPKRTFMRRALEFEIRLSYHDRVLKTLPEPMQNDTTVISDQTPGPAFEYEDPTHPHYDTAQSILSLLRGRSKANEVLSHIESLKTTLESSGTHLHVDNTIRSISIHCLLSIGSRSFSHLLNAIERYLPLLRGLAGTDAESKQDILSAVASFWRLNRQMVNIVFDKLMQYQIVDPTDVVGWTFENVGGDAHISGMRPMSLSAFEWDLLKGALDKANGRVMVARRKVAALRKEHDDSVARVKASVGADVGSIEMDADVKPFKQDDSASENPQLTVALKAFASLTREQKGALARTIEGFVSCLAPSPSAGRQNPYAETVITEQAWEVRATWSADEWNTWETWGWYRHFCRTYSPYLRNYQETLGTVGFAKIEGSTSPAAKLMKKTWGMATGQES